MCKPPVGLGAKRTRTLLLMAAKIRMKEQEIGVQSSGLIAALISYALYLVALYEIFY